jgi:hypothetical protein
MEMNAELCSPASLPYTKAIYKSDPHSVKELKSTYLKGNFPFPKKLDV